MNTKECGNALDHGAALVGYGTDPVNGEYYIVRNSWGPKWGVGGYIYIAIVEGEGICGINSKAVVVEKKKK